jgi:splicing factor 3A subunit 3
VARGAERIAAFSRMSGQLLEQARALHEDLEILERSMYRELGDPATQRLKRVDTIARDQVVATMLRAHTERAKRLASIYEDTDGARREEIHAMSGSGVFNSFYDQLKQIRDYHRKHALPAATEPYEKELLTDVLESAPEQAFTGEEAEGRYLDMHGLHEQFLNLKGVEHVDYASYLKASADLQAIPKATASTGSYARYVRALHNYWLDFLRKTQPLMPIDELLAKATASFHERWARGEVSRWQSGAQSAAQAGAQAGDEGEANGNAAPISLDGVTAASELKVYGLDRLKNELARRGLKCGGSLSQRAERLFLLQSTPLEEMPKQHRAKKPVGGAGNEAATNGGQPSVNGHGVTCTAGGGAGGGGAGAAEVALLEAATAQLGELLAEVIDETVEMIEKKQARTYEEIERDLAAAAELAVQDNDDEDEDEEKPIYNPLNLPMGWDGKPIPYWLYKLHGLNLEFKCEICGNQSYWGPRAFERHFQEWRHAHGMQCLGIPNSKHFQGITLIEDAYTLQAKRKAELGETGWNAELDEEFEDKSGNVMNRKTYTDLARQGLLD